uniref:Uncharacterized protein n=1 Tax=viral metagenome TaxID=1070528 RepID=A0A6C0BE60_9ZZZZ
MSSTRQYLPTEFFVEAFKQFNDDAITIDALDIAKKIKNSSGGAEVSYCKTYIRTPDAFKDKFPLDKYPALMLLNPTKLNGCASFETRREKKNSAGPSFSVYKSTLDKKGALIGETLFKFFTVWHSKADKQFNVSNFNKSVIRVPIQEQYTAGGELKTMPDPIVRIKFKTRKSEDNNPAKSPIWCDLLFIRDGVQYSRFPDTIEGATVAGEQYNNSNIHYIVRSGNEGFGVINLSETIKSSMGISNVACVDKLAVINKQNKETLSNIFGSAFDEYITATTPQTASPTPPQSLQQVTSDDLNNYFDGDE